MSDFKATPLDEIEQIHRELRAGFKSGKSRPIAYRKYQLSQLAYLIKDNMERFQEALAKDLGRPHLESTMLDLGATLTEITTQFNNIEKWTSPEKPGFSLNFFAMKPHIRKEPKGVVLIIAPFNYPVVLSLAPLAGAIAAGNSVLIKPSELAVHTAVLMTELVEKYLDKDIVRVANGAIPETTKILDLPWDHILYTGSGRVAKIVATAAAKHLTPLTLELGGKSPVIIDPKCDLKLTARRLLWGKTVNAGQTCVAPDYILVPREFQDTLVNALTEVYNEFYPDTEKRAAASDSFSRIISPQAYNRLAGLLDKTEGKIVLGGERNADEKYIAPTVVRDVKGTDSLMSDELFGPILPIVPVDSIDAAIDFVNERDHPLALYVFSQDDEIKNKVFSRTQSGAVVANETIVHQAAPGLPFGGVGPSGYGAHTGKFSFDTFTHQRAAMDSPGWVDRIMSFRYPPYTPAKTAMSTRILVSVPPRLKAPQGNSTAGKWWGKWFILALALAATSLTYKKRLLANSS